VDRHKLTSWESSICGNRTRVVKADFLKAVREAVV